MSINLNISFKFFIIKNLITIYLIPLKILIDLINLIYLREDKKFNVLGKEKMSFEKIQTSLTSLSTKKLLIIEGYKEILKDRKENMVLLRR